MQAELTSKSVHCKRACNYFRDCSRIEFSRAKASRTIFRNGTVS